MRPDIAIAAADVAAIGCQCYWGQLGAQMANVGKPSYRHRSHHHHHQQHWRSWCCLRAGMHELQSFSLRLADNSQDDGNVSKFQLAHAQRHHPQSQNQHTHTWSTWFSWDSSSNNNSMPLVCVFVSSGSTTIQLGVLVLAVHYFGCLPNDAENHPARTNEQTTSCLRGAAPKTLWRQQNRAGHDDDASRKQMNS